ncbi:hypothetical protein Ciccas_012432 [Cichlidogyrus casuarinus]|uniref:Uncharacterized protein n=1 Tax=Cichlidogyrus casuarinus TaxID=1844966 RepID=A0ABD2PPD0_9PLAT
MNSSPSFPLFMGLGPLSLTFSLILLTALSSLNHSRFTGLPGTRTLLPKTISILEFPSTSSAVISPRPIPQANFHKHHFLSVLLSMSYVNVLPCHLLADGIPCPARLLSAGNIHLGNTDHCRKSSYLAFRISPPNGGSHFSILPCSFLPLSGSLQIMVNNFFTPSTSGNSTVSMCTTPNLLSGASNTPDLTLTFLVTRDLAQVLQSLTCFLTSFLTPYHTNSLSNVLIVLSAPM